MINKQTKNEINLITTAETHTRQVGKRLSEAVGPGTIVALYGQLGSGKTVLVKGFCDGLEVHDSVTSPTYTLMNIYHGRVPVYHFDFYRLERGSNWDELGLDEYLFDDGVSFIEWPDRLENWLPNKVVDIFIRRIKPVTPETEQQRQIIIRNFPAEQIDLENLIEESLT